MLQTYTRTDTLPVGGMAMLIHGLNSRLILGGGSAGYTLSGTLVRDPWKVEVFSSWVLDNDGRLHRGCHVQLGMLTGESNSAVIILKGGIQGANGEPHVVVRAPLQSDWGLVTLLHQLPNLSPAIYTVRTVVLYERA